jgi:hypothetical protein
LKLAVLPLRRGAGTRAQWLDSSKAQVGSTVLSHVAEMILDSFVIDGKGFLHSLMVLDFYSMTRRAFLTLNSQWRAAVEMDVVFFKKKRIWS